MVIQRLPYSSKANPSLLVWQGQLTAGSKLLCTTSGWGGSVTVSYSFLNEATGQVLALSSAAIVHVNAPAECARAKNARECLTAKLKSDSEKKEEQL